MSSNLPPQSEDAPWWRVGVAPEAARYHPQGTVLEGRKYTRLVVEFVDQGASYHEHQLEWLDQHLCAYAGQHPIVLVFVHEWKHNGRPRDPNLLAMDTVLQQTADAEAAVGSNRHVIGIFVGWRGLSLYRMAHQPYLLESQICRRAAEGAAERGRHSAQATAVDQ